MSPLSIIVSCSQELKGVDEFRLRKAPSLLTQNAEAHPNNPEFWSLIRRIHTTAGNPLYLWIQCNAAQQDWERRREAAGRSGCLVHGFCLTFPRESGMF